jgi:uncharacterized protein (DUF1800 family)
MGMNPRLSRISAFIGRMCFSVCLVMAMFAATGYGQDEDFNSPTPILVSEPQSTRALAVTEKEFRGGIPEAKEQIFWPGTDSKVVLFVTNLDLMDGEGANAFRVYLKEDTTGKRYRMSVESLEPVTKRLYAVTVKLYDSTNYWGQPLPDGDYLVYLTWRGLASNEVKLALGRFDGDNIKNPNDGEPTPIEGKKSVFNRLSSDSPTSEAIGRPYSGDRTRFMQQAAFGPSQALNDRLRRTGIRVWLAEQLAAKPDAPSVPYPNLPLMNGNSGVDVTLGGCLNSPNTNCIRDNYTSYLMQQWMFLEALYGERQLGRRVSWALHQIWVAAMPDVQQPSHMLHYQKVLDKHAFGNFRNLMAEMTLNPAMGQYLDMRTSTANNPNENYPRELLQLFSIGLFMLNQDGTLQLDGQGNPIPTYDQTTVNNFTEIFTGWQLCQAGPPTCPNGSNLAGVPNYIDPMLLIQAQHNTTTKTLLNYPGAVNVNIPAGQNGAVDMTQALDNIYNHPNVGPFVSKLLIQHLVTSDPTPAYVGRVSAVFNANRASPEQLKLVVRAILLDPEARGDIKTDPDYGKLREPFQLLTNVLRNYNVRAANGTGQTDGNLNRFTVGMLQNVYRSPSVFNYYPADYVVPGTTVLGPEFGIQNTVTAIQRTNFMNTIVFGTIAVTLPDTPNGTSIDLSGLQALAAADTTGGLLVDELNKKMMNGSMSAGMRGSILTAVQAVSSADSLARARQALYLVATSSQFQVQR